MASVTTLLPQAQGHFIVGLLPEFQRDMLGMYRDVALEYGDLVRLRFLNVEFISVTHPQHLRHVIQDHAVNYRRTPFFNNIARLVVGDSIFTTDGDDWARRRQMMEPAFHRERLSDFANTIVASAREFCDEWRQVSGSVRDVELEMTRLTLRIIGQVLFSVDLAGEARELGEAFAATSDYVNYRLLQPLAPPLFVPTVQNRRLKRALATQDRTIYAMIRARRQGKEVGKDLLGMLLSARNANGVLLSDAQIRNEITTLMFAGHDATTAALTWAFYLLSQNSGAEEKLHRELANVQNGRVPTVEDLPKLNFARMVAQETLRLYPPAWGITRQSIGEDEIGGYHIPANANLELMIYTIHHDARWWNDPERFDPERFAPERAAQIQDFAYLPFSAAPRRCLGDNLALIMIPLVLATIAQQFQPRLATNEPIVPRPLVTLRTAHGLPMTLQPR